MRRIDRGAALGLIATALTCGLAGVGQTVDISDKTCVFQACTAQKDHTSGACPPLQPIGTTWCKFGTSQGNLIWCDNKTGSTCGSTNDTNKCAGRCEANLGLVCYGPEWYKCDNPVEKEPPPGGGGPGGEGS